MDRVFAERGVESGVDECGWGHSCEGEGVKAGGVDGIEEGDEKERNCKPKGERREGLGGEGG